MKAKLRAEHVARLAMLENGGRLTPSAVVADAKDPSSPLHDLFNWDVVAAAEQHWLDRAREVIRSVRIAYTVENVSIKLPKYVHLDDTPGPSSQGYRTVTSLQRDPVAAREAVRVEFERATGVLRRARAIAVVLGLEGEIDELLFTLAGLATIVSETTESEGDRPSA